MFNRIFLREQAEEKWPDVWDKVICDSTAADTIYTGLMYEGPNFNPRIDTVQIITPAEIIVDTTTHQAVFDTHADDNVKSHAKSIQEKNTLRDKRDIVPEASTSRHISTRISPRK